MGGFLTKPKVIKTSEFGESNMLRYAVSCMQGWRLYMENAHVASINIRDLENWCFFAVFDGHACSDISQYCSHNLLDSILATDEMRNGDVKGAVHNGFLHLDETMRTAPIRKIGGSTAISVLISPTEIFYANCGDSRAVLCRNGDGAFATCDHKPTLQEERIRIENAGGSVLMKRVNGTLAVSRALGDYDFKCDPDRGQCEQLVSPRPEVYTRTRKSYDEFLVLACDGIWDVMSNDEVCQFVYSRLLITSNLVDIANLVLDTCLFKGSRDNMTIIIVVFPGAPKVCNEAVKKEKRLDKQIAKLIKDEILYGEITDYEELMKFLHSKDDIEGLPPGGGLYSKYNLIHRVYKEMLPDKSIEYLEYTF